MRKNDASNLKEFRHKISALKKQGLIPANKRTGKLPGAGARPTDLFGGKPLKDYVKKYDDVLSGKATAVPLSKLKSPTEARKKFEVTRAGGIKPSVLVPKGFDEKVEVRKGQIFTHHPKGVSSVDIPVEYKGDTRQFLKELKKYDFPEMKGRHWYAFNFKGGGSKQVFRSMDDLVRYVEGQKSYGVRAAHRRGDTKWLREVVRSLEIVVTDDKRTWFKENERRAEDREKAHQKQRNIARRGKRRKKK